MVKSIAIRNKKHYWLNVLMKTAINYKFNKSDITSRNREEKLRTFVVIQMLSVFQYSDNTFDGQFRKLHFLYPDYEFGFILTLIGNI